MALIELQSVIKDFQVRGRTLRALDGVSLQVQREQFVALTGPSGCGKSTVLNLVAGLLEPTHGKVMYDQAAVSEPNRRVGYMTQKDTLLPWRSIEDNIGIALELQCRAVNQSERRERVSRIMALVGLVGFERHYPAELSGGMRRRAALARMLIYEPETLLLDEPFGALDAQLKLIMQQELIRITQAGHMTAMFVTHDLMEAIALADTVIIFTGRPGRIRASRSIDLPRPRDVQKIRFSPEFAKYHEELWNELEDEVMREGKDRE